MSADMTSEPRSNFGILSADCFGGSMVGNPPIVFAVMCYAVANARPYDDKELGTVGTLEINPKLLATIFSVEPEDVSKALEVLCAPDEHSRSKVAQGRRLIPKGAFRFHLVNMAKYRKAESQEAMRERWRREKAEQREKARQSKDSQRNVQDSPETAVDSPDVPLPLSLSSDSLPVKVHRARFKDWYDHWPTGPYKRGRADAEKAWKSLQPEECAAALEDIAERSRLWVECGTDMQFEKRPPAFLRSKLWLDPLPEAPSGNKGHMPHSGFDKKDYGEIGGLI